MNELVQDGKGHSGTEGVLKSPPTAVPRGAAGRSNAQSELSALERGMHALHSGVDVKAYAEGIGRARTFVQGEIKAARVAETATDIRHDLSNQFAKRVDIHAAPHWLWPALVDYPLAEATTVEAMRRGKKVKRTSTCRANLDCSIHRRVAHYY